MGAQLRKDLQASREREERRSIEAEAVGAEHQVAAEIATRAAQAMTQTRSGSLGRPGPSRQASASVPTLGGECFSLRGEGTTPRGKMQSNLSSHRPASSSRGAGSMGQ